MSRTTADLRATLWDAIEQVKAGTITTAQASQVANLSKTILDSARVELDYSRTLSKLDRDDQGVSTGPLLLTGETAPASDGSVDADRGDDR